MRIATAVDELRAAVAGARRDGRRVGFVPTMGNLHDGHASLVRLARERAQFVVASVFVNPTQFGPNEDLARYPRTPQHDAERLAGSGCDLMFLPDVATMYPNGTAHAVRVSVPGITAVLDGASRPGHFDGVATVVTRLFNLVQPDDAVFGRKDFQQLLVVRALVRDLAFPIDIIAAPIVREANGLAMSSRNQFLDPQLRARAAALFETLSGMAAAVRETAEPLPAIEATAMQRLREAGFDPDYAVIRQAGDLLEPGDGDRDGLVVLGAARLGGVRLIDNIEIDGDPDPVDRPKKFV
ncbi:MAG: pantoate--beta-alanine ligase [Xanthomonadales bacterium]|nr:pantoate--beta-alanine ligase [Xanthomonadales bacterium]